MKKLIFILPFILFGCILANAQSPADFVTTWKTDNPGVSGPTEITIPTFPNETYNYDVDWNNDGVFDSLGVSGNITHDYGVADTVTIRIRGTFPRIYFNFEGDRGKILSVDQWGTIQWKSMQAAFAGCTNLNSNAMDAPDLSGVSILNSMFIECSTFNGDISGWDVSKVTEMNFMFREAFSFNQDIGGWNVGNLGTATGMFALAFSFNQDIGGWNVGKLGSMTAMFLQASAFNQNLGDWDISSLTYADNMFTASGLSTANYDSLLIGWSTLDSGEMGIPNDVLFSNSTLQYCAGEAARQKLLDVYVWTIQDGGQNCAVPQDFVTTWKTNNPGVSGPTEITIPTFPNEMYNYDVDWDNDGIFDSLSVTGSITHDYGVADTVTIRIRGTFPRIYFNSGGDREKILSVDQWGSIKWKSMRAAFAGCTNLNSNAMDAPDLSGVSNMNSMFFECSTFNGDISGWDVSKVTDMEFMFRGASSFNQDIGGWNVGNLGTAVGMFAAAHSFNQDIGGWNVEKLDNMSSMFLQASAFNQNLGDWDISSLKYAIDMFIASGLSTANYDSLLIGWSQLPLLQSGVMFSAGNSQYCAGAAARQTIIDNFAWSITDGGPGCTVGTNDPKFIADALEVFPNPTTGLVTILADKYRLSGLLRLFDQNGRCILYRSVNNPEQLHLDLSTLPAGLYTLQVIGAAGWAQARVVKQ